MLAARAWLVGRNAARGAHRWNRLPGSSATVWSRRAALLRATSVVLESQAACAYMHEIECVERLALNSLMRELLC